MHNWLQDIKFVYADLNQDTRLLQDNAILATTNASLGGSKYVIAAKRPGNEAAFYRSDTVMNDETNPSTALHHQNTSIVVTFKVFYLTNLPSNPVP